MTAELPEFAAKIPPVEVDERLTVVLPIAWTMLP